MKRTPPISTRIRDYRPGDYPSLKELWDQTDMDLPERGDDAGVIDKCNAQGGRLLVEEDTGNGEIIASSWMTWDGRRCYLHHFCVLPRYQGMGFGTKLGFKSLEWIQEKGYQVKLEVHEENHEAKRLYEKLGFFAFRDYDIYMIRKFKKPGVRDV